MALETVLRIHRLDDEEVSFVDGTGLAVAMSRPVWESQGRPMLISATITSA